MEGDSPNGSMEAGVQPLDALMNRLEIANHMLVAASTEHLTHKMVAKGRRGRRLTRNIQNKICGALNTVLRDLDESPVAVGDLFDYPGR